MARPSRDAWPLCVDWRRAEFVLTLLAFLGFLTLPIRVTTIYIGLPAHPLFIHVQWSRSRRRSWPQSCSYSSGTGSRYGIALALVSIVAMSRRLHDGT
jgi:hypothetical protein